jgi:hypothetical protein
MLILVWMQEKQLSSLSERLRLSPRAIDPPGLGIQETVQLGASLEGA